MSLNNRVKTDMRVHPNVKEQVKNMAGHLGVTESSMWSLAGAEIILRYGPLITSRKTRRQMVQAIKRDLPNLIEDFMKADS